jgi:hypothetical protein
MKNTFITKFFVATLFVALLLCTPQNNGICADSSWRAEFDETCAGTSEAMVLSPAELQVLIAKCERLQKAIEQLDESERKVFLKRLLMCKNLYQYVLDSKKASPERTAE